MATVKIITITNIYDASAETVDALSALNRYDALEGKKFKSGLAVVGNPHIDEVLESDSVLLDDKSAWKADHVASFKYFKSNASIELRPGDSVQIEVRSTEEELYYANLSVNPLLLVEGSDVFVPGDVDETTEDADLYLDRTTGIGDDADPINFDSEALTSEMEAAVAPEDDTVTDDGDGE